MLIPRSESVVKRSENHNTKNKFKGKKKHKRLDAICEEAYTRSQKEFQKVESSEVKDAGNELELRRSSRARKAPVLLDSSPMPPKKRRKVDKGVSSSVEKGRRVNGVKSEVPGLTSRDLEGMNSTWVTRLRTRGRNSGFSRRERGESSVKGKRKLLYDSDEYEDDISFQHYDTEDGVLGEKSTVVKSKRPGRIKATNVLANENMEIGFGGVEDDDIESNEDEVSELKDEVDGLHFEIESGCEKEIEVEDVSDSRCEKEIEVEDVSDSGCEKEIEVEDVHVTSESGHGEETAVQPVLALDKSEDNDNVESVKECIQLEKTAEDVVPDQINAVQVDSATNDVQVKDGHTQEHIEDETPEKSKGKYNVANRKARIKLGRRCGLCGGGSDGKPPKILVLDGAGSDNEAYSGSSASEETNYDVWDGFGDQSGWLGRLLGPINDRFGIAGIWVHQQCAVWSPEVYFAGLGHLKNVRAALYRGRVLKCSRCTRPGATIGCRVDRCPKTYHLPCARAKGCLFDHRKFLIVCTDHRHLFQPHGMQNALRLKKLKAKKLRQELRKVANDACRRDIDAEEKWLENCGEDEEFLKRESKRLHRDLWRITPTYIGGGNSESGTEFQGWESVAGLQDVIRCMKEVVILPLLYPEFFNNLGLTPPRGVLLHGYPGTGKTLVVRALVGSCARGDRRIAYFARKGADCLGKYVGDAERQLRLLFQVAEKSQPSIIFFDEIDGLAPCRSKRQDQTHNSVVSTLLALMDGIKSRGSVIVIGATNRPDSVDPALRRPGRFDREIYFPLPSIKDREAILSLNTQKWPKPITGSLLKWVSNQTVGFAGADLQALCTQAAIIALRRSFPLQEVLLAAETQTAKDKCPAIPTFTVEEKDWLLALSCASPPCSRRESGTALNDVVSSPLEVHLVPCLLLSLIRLLLCLYLDEHVWLPPHLNKASALVKDVIVSTLISRGIQSDNWWLHLDGLLEEKDVLNEIEKNLLLRNILVRESNQCHSDAIDKDIDDDFLKTIPPNSQLGACQGRYGLGNQSGFQVLICGYPRSGQSHIASCLLHFFAGNVDVWKIDLASITHEGHGDTVHGLMRILMGCAGTNFCMLYLPKMDLWAVETCYITSENSELSDEVVALAETDAKKTSYLWTCFVEQVAAIRANTPLIILATSELPFALLPDRVKQFFRNETVSRRPTSEQNHKVSQFSLQLDGKFDHDKVINCFAAKLSRDVAQHFVQSLHDGRHIHEKSFDTKTYEMVEGGDHQVCHNKSVHASPCSPVGLRNRTFKGKSNLLLAISSVGYQVLCYPHFAELCWVTSKLKEGPCVDVSGPWKGWPFNSCIVRPSNSTEKVAPASSTGNVKHRESGLVRGLVAVGLSAYRGEYTSLREVCSEFRKVLAILVERIDEKIQRGKDKRQFIRLLSQAAYLDDVVVSWAHASQSLEADAGTSEINPRTCTVLFDNQASKDCISAGDTPKLDALNINLHQGVSEKSPPEKSPNTGLLNNQTDGGNGTQHTDDEIADMMVESPHRIVLNDSFSLKHTVAPNGVILERLGIEKNGDHSELGPSASVKLSNGFTTRDSGCKSDGPCGSSDKHDIGISSVEFLKQPNGLSLTDNISSKDSQGVSGACVLEVNNGSKPGSRMNGAVCRSTDNILSTDSCGKPCVSNLEVNCGSTSSSRTGDSVAICSYECCSECFTNLHNILVRVIKTEWRLKKSNSTVEDVHDFVASLSANFHLSVHKLFQGGNHYDLSKYRSCREHQFLECRSTDQLLARVCGCHPSTKTMIDKEDHPQIPQGFIFKDGVLATLDDTTGINVSYPHCKFEKLCLSSLIEWLGMSKQVFD